MTSRVRMYSKPVEEDSEYDEDNQRKLYETELNEDELHEVQQARPRDRLHGHEVRSSSVVLFFSSMGYCSFLSSYYHRYKNKSYVRRNDVGKYCQVCKAKRLGVRSRGLPSDLQLRKLWILRFNLEPERAAELWVKDAFSDNSHSGEVCSIHFPECDDDLRTCRELLPLDMRPPHVNADDVDFGNMVLTCVFCSSRRTLKSMIPFVRARSRRRRWISALSNALKNGATKFLCDWHFADSCFSVNTYGEWKLRKDALPNPTENYNQEPTTSTSVLDVDYFEDYVETDVEYSDDSDFELEIIRRVVCLLFILPSYLLLCKIILSVKHEKYLSIMGWPKQFEEEIRRLWVRRRIEPLGVSPGTVYKYPTLTICQGHLEDAGIPEQIESWLSKYCVLCDEELGDKNLLLPFPVEQSSRYFITSFRVSSSCLSEQHIPTLYHHLRERLTRAAATHYRLCLFHFPKTSFLESLNCFYFEIPRGPHGVVKCPLCDTWNIESETTQIRTPRGAAERNFLVEMLISGDKPTLRKGVGKLSAEASTICKMHLPDLDPFELIAERKLVASVTVQCVVCSRFDLAQNMTPFPYDAAKRTMWVDSMSRRRGNRMRLLNRLSLEGRHYICPRHFHPNSLRYGMCCVCCTRNIVNTRRAIERSPIYNPLLFAAHEVVGKLLFVFKKPASL
uniref:THAP-type domain-containing protein n=1 Tax=Angiostrongylus cantonensis TaxID=6313 RepID=A0A158P6X4_ANGCA